MLSQRYDSHAWRHAERLHRRRSAACWDDDDGMTQARQSLAGDGAGLWRAAWDAFVNREFTGRDPEDRRTNIQKRADAAVELARFALAALRGEKPWAAEHATMHVVVRYGDLVDDLVAEWAGEDFRTGLALSGHAVRRLCCDADVVRLVTVGDSQVIDVGRKTRAIPTPTRRAVLARDGGCTFPGCHHRLVHEGGWNLSLDPDSGRTLWAAPDGRRLIGQRRAATGAQRSTAAA